MASNNVIGILKANAEADPDHTLLHFYNGAGLVSDSYTYGAFLKRINYVGARLLDLGVGRGSVALLAYPPGLEVAVAFYACAAMGAIPVPLPSFSSIDRAKSARINHVARQSGAEVLLTVSASLESRNQNGDEAQNEQNVRCIATDRFRGSLDSLAGDPLDTLFLQYTSGSTEEPRGVEITHENVIHNSRLCVDHHAPIGVSWLPHFHDMGLLGYYLYSIVRGGESHCFSPLDFMRRPALWFDLIARNQATITTAPNAAFEYCLREDKLPDEHLAQLDLGTLRSVVNCAEPVRLSTFQRFRQRFARFGLKSGVYTAGYGLAEHTLCVTSGGSRSHVRENDPSSPKVVSCGAFADDVDLRIVDPQTRRLMPEGEVGEIWVDSPSKARGYWRKPELTANHFRARIAGDSNHRGYLRTGDLGFLDGRELFVCGRLREIIILNGRNVFPNDVEATLEQAHPGVLDGRVAAFGIKDDTGATEQLIVLIECRPYAADLDSLIHCVTERFGIPVGALARVARGTIVRTSSGKISRRQCRALWESGQIDVLEMRSSENLSANALEAIVDRLVEQAKSIGDRHATLDRLGLDSIALVDLSMALEAFLDSHNLNSPQLVKWASDLSLLQALKVSRLNEAMHRVRSGRVRTEAVLSMLDDAAENIRRSERDLMVADAGSLGGDPVRAPLPIHEGAFITGGTGFLGAFLIGALVEDTCAPIYVLVRGQDTTEAALKLERAMIGAGHSSQLVMNAFADQIRVIRGDLAMPKFGLGDSDWSELASAVDRIFHLGAEVDYVKSYALLRPVNVLGTREVINFACTGQLKHLHYLSTTFVHGWSIKPRLYEDCRGGELEDLDFGYAQSKWVAEQLVHNASANGLPASIYRPALVTASLSGRFVERDIVCRVLGYMLRHGITVDAPNQISFLPVDVCARNIYALSRQPAGMASVLHMTADEYYTISDVCAAISELYGYSFRPMSLEQFVDHAHENCTTTEPMYPLLSFLDHNNQRISRMGAKRYVSSGYQSARNESSGTLQHPTLHQTVIPIVEYLVDQGLAPPPPAAKLRSREIAELGQSRAPSP